MRRGDAGKFYGTANRATKLIALQRIYGSARIAEKVGRVEYGAPIVLEQISVKFLRAALRDSVHYSAGVLSIFGVIVTRLDAEFLQRVGERERRIDVRVWIDVVATVEHIVRLVRPCSVRGYRNRD